MRRRSPLAALLFLLCPVPCALCPAASAQQAQTQQAPIAYVPTEGVNLSGSLEVSNGKAVIGNNGSITAGDKTATVTLARGGTLQLCSTTTVHLSRDRSIADTLSSALMISLDRGALEASYTTGKYSDVLMTPDLRILISGPGQTDLKIRVSPKGDTCLDNHGADAPYITVTSLLEGGLYRVQPNQRVLFEHGSLNEVVDNETEPCGCPPAILEAAKAAPTQLIGGSSSAGDNPFPLAQSEGLAAAPPPPTTPAVLAGKPHAQVTVPLVYKGDEPAPQPPPDMAPETKPATTAAAPAPQPPPQPQTKKQEGGFFHGIGHFFAKLFGGK